MAGLQGYRAARLQNYRAPGLPDAPPTQELPNSLLPEMHARSRAAGMQGCKAVWLQACSADGLQGCRPAGWQGCNAAGLQGCGVPKRPGNQGATREAKVAISSQSGEGDTMNCRIFAMFRGSGERPRWKSPGRPRKSRNRPAARERRFPFQNLFRQQLKTAREPPGAAAEGKVAISPQSGDNHQRSLRKEAIFSERVVRWRQKWRFHRRVAKVIR